jgi:O-antigen ligase
VVAFFDHAIRLFLYLLIFWLPYSQAVIESAVITGLLLWIAKRVYLIKVRKGFSFQNIPVGLRPVASFLNKPIAVFAAACLISAVTSRLWALSLYGFFSKVLEWFIIFFLISEVFTRKRHFWIALAVMVITFSATVLDSFYQYYISHQDIFLGHRMGEGHRATAAFKTPNGLGAYLIALLPLIGGLFFYVRQRWLKILSAFIFIFGIWSLILTFSRGAWLGLTVAVIFVSAYCLGFQRNRKWILIGIVILFFSGLALWIYIQGNGPLGKTWCNRHGTAAGRLMVWTESLDLVKDRPMFGHGINTYMKVYQAYRSVPSMNPTFAHNCYVQLLCEAGILGLLSFLWIIGALIKDFHDQSVGFFEVKRGPWIISCGILSGLIAFWVHSFFDNNLYSLQLSALMWYMIGLYVCWRRLNEELVVTQRP